MAVLDPVGTEKESALAAWWRHFRYVVSENPVTLLAFCLFGTFIVLALLENRSYAC